MNLILTDRLKIKDRMRGYPEHLMMVQKCTVLACTLFNIFIIQKKGLLGNIKVLGNPVSYDN